MPDRRHAAFVTLCANEAFIPGVRCLARSLAATGTVYPLICMVPTPLLSLAAQCLGSERLELRAVEPLPLSEAFVMRHANTAIELAKPMTLGDKPQFHERLLNFLKLRAWEFCEFKKIVFLDADTVVVRNIDALFHYPSFCAAPNLYAKLVDFHRINSGVFVCAPSSRIFRRMLAALDAPDAFWARTDQTFLETFFGEGGHPPLGLPHFFNTLQYVWFNLPEIWNWPDIHVIHYQFEKPWDEASFRASPRSSIRRRLLAPLVDIWHAIDDWGQIPKGMLVDNRAYLRGMVNDLQSLKTLETSPARDR